MDRDAVNRLCAQLPGAALQGPCGGGHGARRVGGRMLARIGTLAPGVPVKCADVETAATSIGARGTGRAPCFHRSPGIVP